MAIKPPSWCSKAVPTPRGWKHWATSEILLNKQFTEDQINEFYAERDGVASDEKDLHDMIQRGKIEAEVIRFEAEQAANDLESMSKRELEALGREHGVELDRRASKRTLVEQMRDIVPSK
jgi:hypothetical protein